MTIGASVTAAADFPCCGRSRAKERELGKERLLDRERKTLLPRRCKAGRAPSQGEQPGSSHSAGRARPAASSLPLLRRLHPLPGQTATACSGSAKDVKLQNAGGGVFFFFASLAFFCGNFTVRSCPFGKKRPFGAMHGSCQQKQSHALLFLELFFKKISNANLETVKFYLSH